MVRKTKTENLVWQKIKIPRQFSVHPVMISVKKTMSKFTPLQILQSPTTFIYMDTTIHLHLWQHLKSKINMPQKSVPQQCQKLQWLFTMWAIYSPILITRPILFVLGLDGGSHLSLGDLWRTPRQPESHGQKRFLLQVSTFLPAWLSPSLETSVILPLLVHIFIGPRSDHSLPMSVND